MRKSLHRIKKTFSTPEYLKILLLRTIGNFLVLFSLFMMAKTFYLPVKEEIRYFWEKRLGKRYVVVVNKQEKEKFFLDKDNLSKKQPKGLLAQVVKIEPVEILVPQDPNFSVVIPKIGANSKIIANVDAGNSQEYLEALKKGVAHAAGTAFPGEGGHIFLFAHSTDYFWNVGSYNAIFYLLNKLEKGDEVDLFYQGKRVVYQVIEKRIVDPSQVEYLTRKTNREFLTLQTCWPPGTTLKRLLVMAKRVAE